MNSERPNQISHLKKYEIPQDLNTFLKNYYTRLSFSIGVRVNFNKEKIDSILNDFIIYMLEPDQYNQIRYKKYNIVKYPKMTYHGWFLKNLNYYMRDRGRKKAKDCIYFVDEDSLEKVLQNNSTVYSAVEFDSPDSILFMKEILDFLEKYSKEADTSFGSNAYMLFVFKMEGYLNSDLACVFDISLVTVIDWMKKLRSLLKKYLNIDLI